MSARSKQEDTIVSKSPDRSSNNQNFKCMTEVFEEGKLVHYLYNPKEKDTLKAWKKSEACSK